VTWLLWSSSFLIIASCLFLLRNVIPTLESQTQKRLWTVALRFYVGEMFQFTMGATTIVIQCETLGIEEQVTGRQ